LLVLALLLVAVLVAVFLAGAFLAAVLVPAAFLVAGAFFAAVVFFAAAVLGAAVFLAAGALAAFGLDSAALGAASFTGPEGPERRMSVRGRDEAGDLKMMSAMSTSVQHHCIDQEGEMSQNHHSIKHTLRTSENAGLGTLQQRLVEEAGELRIGGSAEGVVGLDVFLESLTAVRRVLSAKALSSLESRRRSARERATTPTARLIDFDIPGTISLLELYAEDASVLISHSRL
jgi:hypothetical protein